MPSCKRKIISRPTYRSRDILLRDEKLTIYENIIAFDIPEENSVVGKGNIKIRANKIVLIFKYFKCFNLENIK